MPRGRTGACVAGGGPCEKEGAVSRGVIITVGSTLLALLVVPGVSAADQWPQFRGPQAGAVADDPALPDTWSETENIVWKIDRWTRCCPRAPRSPLIIILLLVVIVLLVVLEASHGTSGTLRDDARARHGNGTRGHGALEHLLAAGQRQRRHEEKRNTENLKVDSPYHERRHSYTGPYPESPP